jgi:hypothetical protein
MRRAISVIVTKSLAWFPVFVPVVPALWLVPRGIAERRSQ